jgi:hypothetical protein
MPSKRFRRSRQTPPSGSISHAAESLIVKFSEFFGRFTAQNGQGRLMTPKCA